MKLAEKHAHEREEREKREREKRDREALEKKSAPVPPANQIQVKPIIETTSPKQSRKSYGKLANGDHDINTTEDLLRLISYKILTINFLFFFVFFKIYATT